MTPFRWLILITVIARLILWLSYPPQWFPDTGGYYQLANNIITGDFAGYIGFRTPTYPLFLLATGPMVYIGQLGLGLGTAIFLYATMYRQTQRPGLPLAVGLAYSLSYQLFIEAALLTETISAFLLAWSIYLVSSGHRGVWLGLALALAALTKPIFLGLVPLYLFFVPRPWYRFFAPLVLIVGGWSAFNYATVGQFAPSTITGYSLTQQTGRFIELARPEFAALADIYQAHSAGQITHSMTIWRAYPDMIQATGLDFTTLGRRLIKMNLYLIWDYPLLYLAGLHHSWSFFWLTRDYMAYIGPLPSWLWLVLKINLAALFTANLLFFPAAALLAWLWLKNREGSIPLLIIGLILAGSILQAAIEYGENARYSMPFQPWVVFVVLITAAKIRQK